MVFMPEEVSVVEKGAADGDTVTAAMPEVGLILEAETLSIPEDIVMTHITKEEEEEALMESQPMSGRLDEVNRGSDGWHITVLL